jgi:hypothetical protein
MKTPFDFKKGNLIFEILSSNKDDIDYTLLDMVNPYEINDITILDKKYMIFKEIFFVII